MKAGASNADIDRMWEQRMRQNHLEHAQLLLNALNAIELESTRGEIIAILEGAIDKIPTVDEKVQAGRRCYELMRPFEDRIKSEVLKPPNGVNRNQIDSITKQVESFCTQLMYSFREAVRIMIEELLPRKFDQLKGPSRPAAGDT